MQSTAIDDEARIEFKVAGLGGLGGGVRELRNGSSDFSSKSDNTSAALLETFGASRSDKPCSFDSAFMKSNAEAAGCRTEVGREEAGVEATLLCRDVPLEFPAFVVDKLELSETSRFRSSAELDSGVERVVLLGSACIALDSFFEDDTNPSSKNPAASPL